MKKNELKYKDGDRVRFDGYEFTVVGYHCIRKRYIIRRDDGVVISVKENEIKFANHMKG